MAEQASADVTGLLVAWSNGEEQAIEKLLPLVHHELRRLARHYMAGESPNHTLQASALVNEAYLKLIDNRRVRWRNRAHFFGISAQLMRRILVDSARRRHYLKRGGNARQVTFDEDILIAAGDSENIVALDDALKALSRLDARKARVVELRYFGGLTVKETAEVLQVSTDTVLRDWRFAKAWLSSEISRTV